MARIGVTGASGKLGGATIAALLERGVAAADLVGIVRDPARSATLAERGVEIRRGDYEDPVSLDGALRGIDKLAFISTSALGDERLRQHGNVVGAARSAGVKHIFYTSVIKPSPEAIFAASPGHFHTETLIRNSGIPYTLFRNNLYLDLVPLMFGAALATGTLAHNGGEGRIGFVARQDIAMALAAVLARGDHRNRSYAITAASPWSLAEVAAALARASGKTITYQPLSTPEFRQALETAGLPPPVIAMTVALGEAIRAGEFDAASNDLGELLGRAPTTLEVFVAQGIKG